MTAYPAAVINQEAVYWTGRKFSYFVAASCGNV